MIWFTSDHHFGHSKIIGYCKRPFTNVDEMDTTMIDNWNSVVDDIDTVYHLGDFSFGNRKNFDNYICRLKGNIKIIAGNHDYMWLEKWDRYNDYMEPKSKSGIGIDVISPISNIKVKNNGKKKDGLIVLCHYPLAIWERSHFNSYHLHGHSHGNYKPRGKMYDVGVDNNNFFPINITDVLAMMEKKPSNVNYIGDRDEEV